MRLVSDDVLATMTIWQEARGESFEGKVAVAEVIRNRMSKKVHSDGTVAGTVLKAYQFSGYNTKDPNRIPSFRLDDESSQVRSCQGAWDFSRTSALTHGATFYYNPSIVDPPPDWAKPELMVAHIGAHEFFLEG